MDSISENTFETAQYTKLLDATARLYYEEAVKSGLTCENALTRTLWRNCISFVRKRPEIEYRAARTDEERCHALREIGQIMSDDAIPFVRSIIEDYHTSRVVLVVAVEVFASFKAKAQGPRVAKQILRDEIRKIVSRKRGPVFDNYSGYLCARVTSLDTLPSISNNSLPTATLEVWFQTEQPCPEICYAAIDIRDGRDSDKARFSIRPSSETLTFKSGNPLVDAPSYGKSEVVKFPIEALPKVQSHEIWILADQQDRLIKGIRLDYEQTVIVENTERE